MVMAEFQYLVGKKNREADAEEEQHDYRVAQESLPEGECHTYGRYDGNKIYRGCSVEEREEDQDSHKERQHNLMEKRSIVIHPVTSSLLCRRFL
jgi:hypothetical protein